MNQNKSPQQDETQAPICKNIFDIKDQQHLFVGNPFKLDYQRASILTCDKWKYESGGIPEGCFLLAFYENSFDGESVEEAILLRVLKPCPIPSDSAVVNSRIEYYKEGAKTTGKEKTSDLDTYTRFEFSFSGLECSILGTFYKNEKKEIEFGADVGNFYSAHLYKAFKLVGKSLQKVVNLRDRDKPFNLDSNFEIGEVRYSSSKQSFSDNAPKLNAKVYMHTQDILGKRTALFGMTRTGKSNTVKELIKATEELSKKSIFLLDEKEEESAEEMKLFTKKGIPKYPVGQIIFDINGEYANKNLQDKTSIFEMYSKRVTRYSVLEKEDFKVLKTNFYEYLETGLDLMRGYFKQFGKQSDYVEDFLNINLERPIEGSSNDDWNMYKRKVAAYKCCLKSAGFDIDKTKPKVWFPGNKKDLNDKIMTTRSIDPNRGIHYDDAILWFNQVWKNYKKWEHLKNYEENYGREWADNDLKALLRFLSQYRRPDEKNSISGFTKLKPLVKYHTTSAEKAFEIDITDLIRGGQIVIVDLSQGDPEIQKLYSEKICQSIFNSSMKRFIENKPNNFIQFYFEEAHNLFPKKEDKDLSQIYNRIAKEGAKLNLGMLYATQEVSSISSNILKNTQNWFIAHLNNEDEIKELKKFYDFNDFAKSLIRFSPKDKGFLRMKTYSNPFIVPVQINKFE
jgi:DNA helicase HerA-like ATPase